MPQDIISLRQQIENRLRTTPTILTVDEALGEQFAALLHLLNAEQLSLTKVQLTPPVGTTPLPEASTLTGEAALWNASPTKFTFSLKRGSDGKDTVTLTATLAGLSLASLGEHVLPLAAGQAGSLNLVKFNPMSLSAEAPAGTLVLTAPLAQDWAPLGLADVALREMQFQFAALLDPDWGPTERVNFLGTLQLKKTALPITVEMPLGMGSWRIGLRPPGITVNVLSDLAELFGGADLVNLLPAQLVSMTALRLQALSVQFDPGGPSWGSIDLVLNTANAWPIAAGLQVQEVGLTVRLRPGSPAALNGILSGRLQVGSLTFSVTIPLPLQGILHLSGQSNQPLPGFGDLATLVDAPFAANLPAGVANLGSLWINQLWLDYDLSAKQIASLGIDIASVGDWTLLPGHLSLAGLQFQLQAVRAGTSWRIAGGAQGTLTAEGIRVGAFVKGGNGLWELGLTEPLVLPSVRQLARMIGGDEAVGALPPGLGEGVGGITIHQYAMVIGSQGVGLQSLSLRFGTSNAWVFQDPYFVLADLDVTLAVDGPTGQRNIQASVRGLLRVAGVDILLTADHPVGNAGWQFEGSTALGQDIPMGTLLAELASYFNLTSKFPQALSDLTIDNISISFNTSTRDFLYTCELTFPVAGHELDMTVDIALAQVNGKFEKTLKGKLLVGELQFDLNFDTGGVSTAFWGDYQNPGGGKITISELVQLLTPDAVPGLDGLSFNVKNAFAGYYKGAGATDPAKWLLGLDMDFGADLSALPLVGKYVPKEEALRLVFQPRIATQLLLPADVAALRAIVPAGITLADSFEPGVTLHMELNMGSTAVPINLPIGAQSVQPTGQAPTITAGTTSPTPALADKATWFSLQKSFGPLHLQRVGVQYENSLLTFLLDGGFSIAGLTLSLNGLSASTRLNPLALSFDLQGLGIDFKGGAVEIGAAFLKEELTDENNVKYTAYDGMAIIRAAQFSLSAIGSYAEYQGHPSMFLYAVLDSPIGGPAFFFVTGLAAGFGYNRALRVPTIDQVQQFPLVAQAIAGVPNSTTDIGTQIRSLHTYIPPAVGEYFLAVGIKFTSFKLIESFALLIVSFGKSLEIDLLGISTLVLPAPQEGNVITPLAEVQLAMKASYLPDVGFLGVEAKLTSASYLFSRACHLTGGFAFYTWFAGAHKDEFVLTIGGYHPSYQRPAHYPNVDKLGFNWVINSNMSIKGDAYFALVPSAVMAGVHLNALWQDGSLSAWFNAGADFIMSWQPYHYDARVYVDIGVSYTYHFFGTHHITAEAGADLHIWGPEFTGTAHVHLWIVTFDVNFGSSSSAAPRPISWPAFTKAFLPKPAEVCGLAVVKGLEKKKEQTADASAELVINPKELLLSFNSLIPLKSAHQKGDSTKELVPSSAATNWGIGPMGLAAGAVTSKAVLEITRTHGGKKVDMAAYFTCTPAQKGVPVALWGQTLTPSLNGRRLIENVVCGFDIGAAPPAAPAETSFIDRDKLQFSLDEIASPQWRWVSMPPFGVSPAAQALNDTSPVQENTRRAYLRDHLTTGQDQRTHLLQQLGFATPVFFNNSIADAFTVAPQVAEVLP